MRCADESWRPGEIVRVWYQTRLQQRAGFGRFPATRRHYSRATRQLSIQGTLDEISWPSELGKHTLKEGA